MKSIRSVISRLNSVKLKLHLCGPLTRTLWIVVSNHSHLEHLSIEEWSHLAKFACKLAEFASRAFQSEKNTLSKLQCELLRSVYKLLQAKEAIDPAAIPQILDMLGQSGQSGQLDQLDQLGQLDFSTEQIYHPWLMACLRSIYETTHNPVARDLGLRLLSLVSSGRIRSKEFRIESFMFLKLFSPSDNPLGTSDRDSSLRWVLQNAAEFEIAPINVEFCPDPKLQLPFRPVSMTDLTPFVTSVGLSTALLSLHFANGQEQDVIMSSPASPTSSAKRRRTISPLRSLLEMEENRHIIFQTLAFAGYSLTADDIVYICESITLPNCGFWLYVVIAHSKLAALPRNICVKVWNLCLDSILDTYGSSSGASYCLSRLVPIVANWADKQALALLKSAIRQLVMSPPLSSGSLCLFQALHSVQILDVSFEQLKIDRLSQWIVKATKRMLSMSKMDSLPPLLTQYYTVFTGISCSAVYAVSQQHYLDLLQSRTEWLNLEALSCEPQTANSSSQRSLPSIPPTLKEALDCEAVTFQANIIKFALYGLLHMVPNSPIESSPNIPIIDRLSLVWFAKVAINFGWSNPLLVLVSDIAKVWPNEETPDDKDVCIAHSALSANPNLCDQVLMGISPSKSVLIGVADNFKSYTSQRSQIYIEKCISALLDVPEDVRVTSQFTELVKFIAALVAAQSPYSRLRNAATCKLVELLPLLDDSKNIQLSLITSSDDLACIRLVLGIQTANQAFVVSLSQQLAKLSPRTQVLVALTLMQKGASPSLMIDWILQQPIDENQKTSAIQKTAGIFKLTPQQLLADVSTKLFVHWCRHASLDAFPFSLFDVHDAQSLYLLSLSGSQDLPSWSLGAKVPASASIPIAVNTFLRDGYHVMHRKLGPKTCRALAPQILLQLSRDSCPRLFPCDAADRVVEQLLYEASRLSSEEEQYEAWQKALKVSSVYPNCENALLRGVSGFFSHKRRDELEKEVSEYVVKYQTLINPETTVILAFYAPFEMVRPLLRLQSSFSQLCRVILDLEDHGVDGCIGKIEEYICLYDDDTPFEYYAFLLTRLAQSCHSLRSQLLSILDASSVIAPLIKWTNLILANGIGKSYLESTSWLALLGELAARAIALDPETSESLQDVDEELAQIMKIVPYCKRRLLLPIFWSQEGWISEFDQCHSLSYAARLSDLVSRGANKPTLGPLADRVQELEPVIAISAGSLKDLSDPILDHIECGLMSDSTPTKRVALQVLVEYWKRHASAMTLPVASMQLVASACIDTSMPYFGVLALELLWSSDHIVDSQLLDKLYTQIGDPELKMGIPSDASIRSIMNNSQGHQRLYYDLVDYEFGEGKNLSSSLAKIGIFRLASELNTHLKNYELPWLLQQWSLPSSPEPYTMPEVLFDLFKQQSDQLDFTSAYGRIGLRLIREENPFILGIYYAKALMNIEKLQDALLVMDNNRDLNRDIRHGREIHVRLTSNDVVKELVSSCRLLCSVNETETALETCLRLNEIATTPQEQLCALVNEAQTAWFLDHHEKAISMLKRVVTNDRFYDKDAFNGCYNASNLLCTLGEWSLAAKSESGSIIVNKYFAKAEEIAIDVEQRGHAHKVLAKYCDEAVHDHHHFDEIDDIRTLLATGKYELQQLTHSSDPHDSRRAEKTNLLIKAWSKDLARLESEHMRLLKRAVDSYIAAMALDPKSCGDDMSRLISIWFQYCDNDIISKTILRKATRICAHLYIPWLNQLTSRLVSPQSAALHAALQTILLYVAIHHPHHTLWPLLNLHLASSSEGQPSPDSVSSVNQVWTAIAKSSQAPAQLRSLMIKVEQLAKSMRTVALRKLGQDNAKSKKLKIGSWWVQTLPELKLPVPTAEIPIHSDGNYDNIPVIVKAEPEAQIANGLSAPKIVTLWDSSGTRQRMLLKSGHDDLRQDAVMEQAFSEANQLLPHGYTIRTYKVVPLGHDAGAIEFVQNTRSLMEILEPLHKKYDARGWSASKARAMLNSVRESGHKSQLIAAYDEITANVHPVMRYFFFEQYRDCKQWLDLKTSWSRSVGVASIVGYILGLGDRHCNNLLIDVSSGEVIHIDLGIAFDHGKRLRIPETVPFRLTRDVVDGMGITGTRGVYTAAARRTLDALRKKQEKIITVLEVFRYDALYKWKVSTHRSNQHRSMSEKSSEDRSRAVSRAVSPSSTTTDSAEAESALRGVRKKLAGGGLSVEATVKGLIRQSTDPVNLAFIFSGWCPFY